MTEIAVRTGFDRADGNGAEAYSLAGSRLDMLAHFESEAREEYEYYKSEREKLRRKTLQFV